MEYKPEDLAYIAGLIDGEGCVTLIKAKLPKRDSRSNFYYNPRVTVSMQDSRAIDFINNIFPAGVAIEKGINRPSYKYYATGKFRVTMILEALLPYLIVKREQAELLLNYIYHRRKVKRIWFRKGDTTYDEVDHKFFSEIQLVKRIQ